MTRVFIKRISPASDIMCQGCKRDPETKEYSYIESKSMRDVWTLVQMSLGQMDPTTTFLQDTDLLYLRFPRGLREEDILWLLGEYFEYVEDRVVLRG